MELAEYDKIVNTLLHNVRQLRADILETRQTDMEKCNVIETALKCLMSDTSLETVESIVSFDIAYAIANNKPLSKEDAEKINQDNFDVIIDIPHHLIKAKKNPADKSSVLVQCDCSGIGGQRLEIMAYMAARKGVWISIDEIERDFPSVVEPGSFTKTISVIRKALGDRGANSPYIKTKCVKSSSGRAAYMFDPKWNFLVIKKIF